MIDGYERVRPLSSAEADALPILAARSGAAFHADASCSTGSTCRLALWSSRRIRWNTIASCASTSAPRAPRTMAAASTGLHHDRRPPSLPTRVRHASRSIRTGRAPETPAPAAGARCSRVHGDPSVRPSRAASPRTTNNRMELMRRDHGARRTEATPVSSIYGPTASMSDKGITSWLSRLEVYNGWKHGRQEAREERGALAAHWMRPAFRHQVHWHWVKGHAGHVENEEVDGLAREGMAPFLKR